MRLETFHQVYLVIFPPKFRKINQLENKNPKLGMQSLYIRYTCDLHVDVPRWKKWE